LSTLKTAERERARALRTQGWSVKEIERELAVARSSVSLWVRDIELSEEARRRLLTRTRPGQLAAARKKAERAREVRRVYQEDGRKLIRERGARYTAGCMLYWAEGAKGRNQVRLVNSDPALLVSFVRFLRSEFDVEPSNIIVRCNLFADHVERQLAIERFWLDTLGVPMTSLRKSHVNVYSKYSQKKRANKLPYGTCEVGVHSTRIVQTIYGSIQEYGGFDRPEWLD
jgi:hypothetical protein